MQMSRRKQSNKKRLTLNFLGVPAVLLGLIWAHPLMAQTSGFDDILARMDKEGCATLSSGVKVCRYDYSVAGKAVEAISFVPGGDGPFPGVLMIPGYDRTARDSAPLGIRLAREAFSAS